MSYIPGGNRPPAGYRPPCVIVDCEKPVVGRQLCRRHWDKAKREGTLDQWPKFNRVRDSKTCPSGHLRSQYTANVPSGKVCRLCSTNARYKHRDKLKKTVFDHYDNRCACCGEANEAFFCIDHVNNDGAAHRKELGNAALAIYKWLVDHNFPDGFQLLCFNCNMAKSFTGVCPHQDPTTHLLGRKEVFAEW